MCMYTCDYVVFSCQILMKKKKKKKKNWHGEEKKIVWPCNFQREISVEFEKKYSFTVLSCPMEK